MTKNFKDNKNYLVAVIIFIAAIIKIYFFNLVKNQAHWWDSLAYGSLAKNLVYHRWEDVPFLVHESIIRPPLFPLLWSWLIRIGSSDYTVIFITNIIPSIISVFLIYLIAKEMYSYKIGIISAILASVSWIHIFYASRALTDIPSMCLALTSIYFFVKSYDSLNPKFWCLSVFFLSFAVLFRYSYGLIALIYITFLIFTHKTKLVKKKSFWLGGIVGAIPLIIFVMFNLLSSGSIFPAATNYVSSAEEKTAFAWYTLSFVNSILLTPILILFYMGLILIVVKTLMSYGFISKTKETRMNLFNILLLLITLSFYIFFLKASEDRYLMSLSSVFFIFSAIGLRFLYRLVSPYNKNIALSLCILIIVWSAYSQISFAKSIMIDKKESFKQMKEAFEWIHENTPENVLVTGDWAEPYTIYYANRNIEVLPQDLDFSKFTLTADYVVLTAVHQPNEKVGTYVNSLVEKGILSPIKVFYFDESQKNVAVIIYKKVRV